MEFDEVVVVALAAYARALNTYSFRLRSSGESSSCGRILLMRSRVHWYAASSQPCTFQKKSLMCPLLMPPGGFRRSRDVRSGRTASPAAS